MRDYEKLLEQTERMIHKYYQKENVRQNYGEDLLLTQTEIHMITAIGAEPGIGVRQLAQKKGVTDGAVSQMIRKLVNKNLVIKKTSQESDAKIELTLTKEGRRCFKEHQKIHMKKNKQWYGLLDELDDSCYKELVKLFQQTEEQLDKKE